MINSSALGSREFVWANPDSERQVFVLRARGEEIGWLQFESGLGVRSTAELEGQRWTFERTGVFHACVTIRIESSDASLAEFTPFLTGGGGVVSFTAGTQYCWNRARIWSTNWCFRCKEHKSTVCVSQEAGSLTGGGKVVICSDAAHLPETPVLVLLAWYLRVLAFERLAESLILGG